MDIRITGQKLVVKETLKAHLREKMGKFEKYAPRLVEAHVILKQEKHFVVAEITLLAKNLRAYGEGTHKDNVYAAIDQAYSRVEKQLKKFREKVKKDHHRKGSKDLFGEALTAIGRKGQTSADFRPKIVKTKNFSAKPMSLEEAGLQLGISETSFLVFQNSESQKVNVLFKREDGHYGLIEPNF